MKKIALCMILLLFGYSISSKDALVNNKEKISLNIGISFPPVEDSQKRQFSQKHLQNLGISRIRIGEDWSFREPENGKFHWKPLEKRLLWGIENDIEVLLTIQSRAPKWRCKPESINEKSCVFSDNDIFEEYIEHIAKNYGSMISKVQFGNEWQSEYWFSGNAQDYVSTNNIVYNTFKKYSPKTQVVLGGFTANSIRALTACSENIDFYISDDNTKYSGKKLKHLCESQGAQKAFKRIDSVMKNAQYDIIDLHLYDDSENWNTYINFFKETFKKPILVSEFGGQDLDLIKNNTGNQAHRMKEYVHVLNSSSVLEAYFFTLVDGQGNKKYKKFGLIDKDLQKKESYKIVKNILRRSGK